MRISDWSSDVCSSDLPPAIGSTGDKPFTLVAQIDIVEQTIRQELKHGTVEAIDVKTGLLVGAEDDARHPRAREAKRRAINAREDRRIIGGVRALRRHWRSEEHTSELQSLMRLSYAVFCLKKKNRQTKKKD